MDDLQWLGLHWDGEVLVQSRHFADYQARLDDLAARGLLYPCFCSRAEIRDMQSAPHGAPPVYPGTCRALPRVEREARISAQLPYALRLNMKEAVAVAGACQFYDEGEGWVRASPQRFGDVVLARRDTPASYHLCAVHDDAVQDITHIIRGEDLREATHVHVLLQVLFGLPTPAYVHHRLIRGPNGARLAKRDGAATLISLRAAGVSPAQILAQFREVAL